MNFSPEIQQLLEARYFQKGEDWEELCRRVARAIAYVEKTKGLRDKYEADFFDLLYNCKFLANSPVLWGAGVPKRTLSACFVIPIQDNLQEIWQSLGRAMMIFKAGGGVGINFSKIRPSGAPISCGQNSKGVMPFIKLFNEVGRTVDQVMRRAAEMSILDCRHPDIREFIVAKSKDGDLTYMNQSIAITDAFMERALNEEDKTWKLVFDNIEVEDNAEELFNLMAEQAWKNGEPGMVFIDRIQQDNSCPKVAKIKGTNPCSEQPLRPNEACTLGSINLDKFVSDSGFFYETEFIEAIHTAIRFLDNTIDANFFPDDIIDNATKYTRPIGLGIMGLADYLIKRKVVYGSEESLEEVEYIFKLLRRESLIASARLGEEKGSFHAFRKSKFKSDYPAMRNSQQNTVAPTGSLSLIAGCSPGIEPYYSFASIRRTVSGFKDEVVLNSKYHEQVLSANRPAYFISGSEVSPENHIRVLATAQDYIDTGISKTISLPEEATVEDVKQAFKLAWELGCKGVTVFRDRNEYRQALLKEVCPIHKETLVQRGRCYACPICGWSNRCTI